MANSKKRRKIIIFSIAGVVLAALATGAVLRKREAVITIQTEKVTRRNLTELVTANGKIQPVIQVKISPEVSGEIIALPLKEGQHVNKGDLILKIKPDYYLAARNQAEANYKSSLAGQATAEANLRKAAAEYKRNLDLFNSKLISDSAFDEVKAAFDVAQAQLTSSQHQVEMSKASMASSEEELAKTTIVSPLTGTVSKLDSEVGERVVGTATMAGTEVMTIADLNQMEARVDIGEMDVVLISTGQVSHLEVDAFKDRKFTGIVTEIANSSETPTQLNNGQDATKFQVKIRISEKVSFRPGMSVTADIETRSRTNVLTVPIASVTARVPKEKDKKLAAADDPPCPNPAGQTNSNSSASGTNSLTAANNGSSTNGTSPSKKAKESQKPIEAVFLKEGERAKMAAVKLGISDADYWEVTEGLKEGQEVVSGGFRAISRDLEDGKRVKIGPAAGEKEKEKEKEKGD